MTTPGHDPAHANQVSRWIARMEVILAGLSSVAMAAIMVIVTIDVVLRYAFAAPLSWSYEMIGLYLVGAVLFFGLSDTMHQHGHIALDIFVPLVPMRLLHAVQATGFAAGTVLVGLIAWLEAQETWLAFIRDDRLATIIPWPTWIAHAILVLGVTVLTLRCAYLSAFHCLSAATGRVQVELPPPPVTAATQTRGDE